MSRFNLRSRKTLKLSTQKQCSKCQRHMFCDEEIENDDENEVICVDCEKQPTIEPEVKKQQRKRKLPQLVPANKMKIEKDDSENQIYQSSDGMSYENQIDTNNCTPMVPVHTNVVLMKTTTNNRKNFDKNLIS